MLDGGRLTSDHSHHIAMEMHCLHPNNKHHSQYKKDENILKIDTAIHSD